MMSEQRKQSAQKARDAGYFIPPDEFNYTIQRDFPPKLFQIEIWRQLCDVSELTYTSFLYHILFLLILQYLYFSICRYLTVNGFPRSPREGKKTGVALIALV